MAMNVTLKEELTDYIERMVLDEGVGYLEACMEAMDAFGLDMKTFTSSLPSALKQKLEKEAGDLGYLKGNSKPAVTF